MVVVSTVEMLDGAGCALMAAPTRRTGADYSKGKPRFLGGLEPETLLRAALVAASFGGALMLVASDFLTLFEVRAVTAKIKDVSGGDNHSYAMTILGLVALPMAYGATRSASRPAMAALAALGAVAALVALAFDLPDATGTNTLARTFADASGQPQIGFYVETLGAVLLLVAGAGGLLLGDDDRAGSRARPARARGDAAAARRDDEERERAAAERARRRGGGG